MRKSFRLSPFTCLMLFLLLLLAAGILILVLGLQPPSIHQPSPHYA